MPACLQAEEDLQSLRRNVLDEEGATKGQRAEVEKHQVRSPLVHRRYACLILLAHIH